MLIILNIILILILLHYLMYFKNKKRIDMIKDIPGPKTVPFFGNAFIYLNKKPEGKQYFFFC